VATGPYEKFLATIEAMATPFVVMVPDDDVTFPHAISAALAHLDKNPDYVAAHGYVLRFGMHRDDVDIHSVYGFTPTIGQAEPLQRLYHLIRRYQEFVWAVFRRQPLTQAMRAANGADGILFQEMSFAATAVLSGKIARLPVIYAMRGMEESMSALERINPLFWFLDDSKTFFRNYAAYRNELVRHIRDEGLAPEPVGARRGRRTDALWDATESFFRRRCNRVPFLRRAIRNLSSTFPGGSDLQQIVDMIHATWLVHEFDPGVLNHAVRQRLGDPMPELGIAPAWPGWREPEPGDVIHPSRLGQRRYIWRRNVLNAEPREEIAIDAQAIAQVESELEGYRLD
jgi:hypothetical protein